MSRLHEQIDDYIDIRRGLGFKLRGHERLLKDLADYLHESGVGTVTVQSALAWATRPADVQPVRWKQRLSVVRGFARYLHAFDPAVEVPPADLLAHRHHRPTPFLYTEDEVLSLMVAADTLRPALHALTYRTLFGLLAATGLRLGEAIGLDRADVDLQAGVIRVRQTKFNKSRSLPLHPTVVATLDGYRRQRDRMCRNPKAPSFFISVRGTRLLDTCVHSLFRRLAGRVGLQPRAGSGLPRVHDMRHTFAVATLRSWYEAGADVAARMPLLSAYLGHAHPVSTYWYLQAAPELLALAAERIQPSADGQS